MDFINNIVIVHSITVKENLVINRDITIKFEDISIIVVILDTREVVHTVKDFNKHLFKIKLK
jgi:hypothetical protein